jgi:hypothetical protein
MTPILGIMASSISGSKAVTSSYESIATVLVGSGGQASADFTSIPSTYKHLQLRVSAIPTTANNNWLIRFNSDSGTNYSYHGLYTIGGTSVSVTGSSSAVNFGYIGYQTNTTNPSAIVTDILDYTNTNKYKVIRSLYGQDNNGDGNVFLSSTNWMNTNAITNISFYCGGNLAQNTKVALYGIKA